jgi:hypothetical protein
LTSTYTEAVMGFFTRSRAEAAAKVERLKRATDGALTAESAPMAPLPPRLPAARQPGKTDFAVANYDVPHCTYKETEEGFTVEFKKTSLQVRKAMSNLSQQTKLAPMVGAAIGTGIIAAFSAKGGSRIEVTHEAVIVDGKKMARHDFVHFHISHTWKGATLERGLAVLGYKFGNQSFEFGGAWPEEHATEVASSLNTHLKRAPRIGDEASPEMLRAARPTDF